jgi:release factor glutamine methyltransferase
MIISNPPYIPTQLIGRLMPEIYKYEPISALDGDKNGLFCLRHIINTAHEYLNPEGSLLLEIGHDQKNDVQSLIDQCGSYEQVVFTKDYGGYDRVVRMKKKKE